MLIILDDNDCGWVSTLTVLDNRNTAGDRCLTRRFVCYLRRSGPEKRELIIREREAAGLGPILHVVGGEFESMGTLEAEVDALIVTFLGRIEGDTTGPFRLQEERVEVLGIWPLGLAACMRLRNVARIIQVTVPSAAEPIRPYTR